MTCASQIKYVIPPWLIWTQCIAFIVLYAVWILPEIVGVRNTALVVGALAGLHNIYQCRQLLFQKGAIPFWLIVTLFIWATFHLVFLSQDYPAQLLEYKRIWKYAALGAIFAFGLGLSLVNLSSQKYWCLIYFGLMSPILIYAGKFFFTILGLSLGANWTVYATLLPGSAWISKYNYVAFCLPTLAIAFGQIRTLANTNHFLDRKNALLIISNAILISATLFLFYNQNIRNGIAYAFIIFGLFIASMFVLRSRGTSMLGRLILFLGFSAIVSFSFYLQTHKNSQWNSFIEDAKIALQTEKYPQWKFGVVWQYPTRADGQAVSGSNYERLAWGKVGAQLASESFLGFGLVEDSFKRLAKVKWPEVSSNLSHSHSGWIDLILAVGYPGFFCVFGALICALWQSGYIDQPWKNTVFWGLLANLLLWCTTEVCTNITFVSLLFWIALASGLTIKNSRRA